MSLKILKSTSDVASACIDNLLLGEVPMPTLPLASTTNGVLSGLVLSSTTNALPAPVWVMRTRSLDEVPDTTAVVNVPAAALDPPMTAPSMLPPSMSTAVAACVAIVSRPRFVREAEAEETSDRLLAAVNVPAAEIYAATHAAPSYTFIALATLSNHRSPMSTPVVGSDADAP